MAVTRFIFESDESTIKLKSSVKKKTYRLQIHNSYKYVIKYK